MTNAKKVCLGKIVGVHGIRGEVKVKSYTAKDTDIDTYGLVEDKLGKKFEIKVTGHSKELLRVKIKGIDDRTTAEGLRGLELYIDRTQLPDLEEEEYYLDDLVGLEVKQAGEDQVVGQVIGVYNFGAGDVLELRLKESNRQEMIPFSKAYVPEVKIKEGYIIVESVLMNFIDEEEDEAGAEG